MSSGMYRNGLMNSASAPAQAPASFDKFAADGSGGMDVMGSIKAHGNFGAQYGMGGDPTNGMMDGGGVMGIGNIFYNKSF